MNLALARVAAHRGSIEDATRYYHNAMYGVWNSDPDANRNKARIELIQFLLKKNAPDKAESELMALATALPPDSRRASPGRATFRPGAGLSPARSPSIKKFSASIPPTPPRWRAPAKPPTAPAITRTAQRYLQAAVNANPQDADSRQLLGTTDLILRTNPFHSHISDAERNRRITAAFAQAEKRLTECAQQKGVDLNAAHRVRLSLCQPHSASPLLAIPAGPPPNRISPASAPPRKPISLMRSWTWSFKSNSRPPQPAASRRASTSPCS